MKREYKLQIRLTDDEEAQVRQAAALSGMSMSEFGRFLLVSAAVGIISQNETNLTNLLNSTGKLIFSKSKGFRFLPGMGLGEKDV